MYETLEGPKHKKNWLPSIPVEPARLLLKHIQDVYNCFFASEIKGALAQKTGDKKYDSEAFLTADRVKRRFFANFEASYKQCVKSREVATEDSEATPEEEFKQLAGEGQKPAIGKPKVAPAGTDVKQSE